MLASELLDLAEAGTPLYVFVPGMPPLRVVGAEMRLIEQVGDVVLAWCSDPTHPFAETVNVLRVSPERSAPGSSVSQTDGLVA